MSKIFFIDDNHNLCLIWKLLFERHGYDIEVFQDGESALKRAESSGFPEIVITDYNLPGLNGVELLNAFQSHKPTTSIILTGDKEKLEGAPEVSKEYIILSKPIQFEKIRNIIEGSKSNMISASNM